MTEDLITLVEKNFPGELRARRQWVLWKYETRGGKVTKVPYNSQTGGKAITTDPSTWRDFFFVGGAYRSGGYDGVGFVFTPEDDYCGIDIDHRIIEGVISDDGWDVIDLLDSYSELSPSGTGLHVFVRGTLPTEGRKNGDFEIYSEGRFFTVTGNHIEGTPMMVYERDKEVWVFHQKYIAKPARPMRPVDGNNAPVKFESISDEKLLGIAREATNGQKFKALYDLGSYGDYTSQSEADSALASLLMFWTGNDEMRADRLFRGSKLMREKWDAKRGLHTYGEITLSKARQGTWFGDPNYKKSIELRLLRPTGTDGQQVGASALKALMGDADSTVSSSLESVEGSNRVQAVIGIAGLEVGQEVLPRPGGGRYDKAGNPIYDLQDAGELWAKLFGNDWAYQQGWHAWTGTHWQSVGAKHPKLDIQAAQILRTLSMLVSSIGKLDGAIRTAAAQCLKDLTDMPGLVNHVNGTFDTAAWELKSHDRNDGLTSCLPYEFTPYTDFSNTPLDDFLNETIPDPTAKQAFMSHLGLALLGDKRLHFALILFGPSRSGKGTLMQLANAVCGHLYYSYGPATIFSNEAEGDRKRAEWNRRGVVCVDELPTDTLKTPGGEELAKQIIGHSGVSMRKIYSSEILDNQWKPKIIMATNDKPMYRDRSGALTRRFIVIPCPNGHNEETIDPGLFDRLLEYVPVFATACIIEGLETMKRKRYLISDEMRALLASIEAEGDPIKSFVMEKCEFDPDGKVYMGVIYQVYTDYCRVNGYHAVGNNKLAAAIVSRYGQVEAKKSNNIRLLKGLRLLEEIEE